MDLIDRQAAIDATWEEPMYTDPLNVLAEVRDRIRALPSAQPDVTDTNVGDMISRQAAINTLIRESQADGAYGYLDAKSINDALERMPTADAVEVVRCKDCKYRDADDFCTGRGYPNVLVPDDGFCDKGERRE